MDTENLRILVDVAQRLSFAAVAKARGINPSSVSRTIAQLEAQLGLRLFQRTTRTMTLTDAGDVYFRRVRAILEELDQAEEQARQLDSRPRGNLRLTASVAFGERVIVPLIADFRSRYPELSLELLFTDANIDLVSEGIDLAVRLSPEVTGDVVATRLCPTHYRVVASPEYAARAPRISTPQDLTQHQCVVFALPAFRSDWRFRPRGPNAEARPEIVPIRSRLIVSSALSLRSLVLAGAGPALLADWLVDEDIRVGRLIDLLPDQEATATTFESAAWLLTPTRAYLPQRVRVTIDYLKERLTAAPPAP